MQGDARRRTNGRLYSSQGYSCGLCKVNTITERHIPTVLCPECGEALDVGETHALCPNGHEYGRSRGVLDVMTDAQRAAVAPFLKQYDTVRSAERWGDGNAEYYRNLPYRDTTGLHTFEWRIKRASFTELLTQLTARNVQTALDAGAGNCWLSYQLWLAGFRGAATDIRVDDYDGLEAPSRYWPQASEWLRVRMGFETPCFAPAQFDAVVFNASLHYAKRPGDILAGYLPLLTPRGALYVIDSPVYRNRHSGEQMMREREEEFRAKYNIEMTETTQSYFLTFDGLQALATDLQCTLKQYAPHYGLKWKLRPLLATALRRREPASFGVYVFEKG